MCNKDKMRDQQPNLYETFFPTNQFQKCDVSHQNLFHVSQLIPIYNIQTLFVIFFLLIMIRFRIRWLDTIIAKPNHNSIKTAVKVRNNLVKEELI